MIGVYTGKRGELNFEDDLVERLTQIGWESDVLKNLTVRQSGDFDEDNITSLEGNLRKILNERNRKELNGIPLSDYEFQQVMSSINNANTPVKANILINGNTLCINRDADSADTAHQSKPVYLNVFNQAEIASGNSRYQIARQTQYETGSYSNDRRGDVTLLINGLPVIHIELKAEGVPVDEALNQIQKYKRENVFTGLMGLIQVFFVMNPDDARYFANYGKPENRNDVFVFHWADENSNPILDWKVLCDKHGTKYSMLSIPEAHQFVAYYTVADRLKDTLKVMRSYQYYAVRAILARTKKQKWGTVDPLGGINWCTTGGGKTMSSFKAGQTIRDMCLADKVVFVVDRKELNSQSLEDYNSFSKQVDDSDPSKGEVVDTKTSHQLFAKLKSDDTKDALIITSIQKMNKINEDSVNEKQADLAYIQKKRIVFIVDEAQRSQFGTMHERVKNTFPLALFFGFTGTPIMGEGEDDTHDSRNIFGDYISVYTIAAGIRDENVLGFDPKAVPTYTDNDLREVVALEQAKATKEEVIKGNPEFNEDKYKIYRKFFTQVQMSSEYKDSDGQTVKGIEGYLPPKQYDNIKHRQEVVNYILDHFGELSEGEKGTRFHALLSTANGNEGIKSIIEYYHLFKASGCNLNVTAMFDFNINGNSEAVLKKEQAIEEIVDDYNKQFGTSFTRKTDPSLAGFKKDIMLRLAHKKPYNIIGSDPDKIIDILLIDDQLLTGYDSQYINTLYLDRVIESHKLIQAISRTNRIYDKEEKPFGIFRFFQKVHTMQDNLKEALRLYCEGDSVGVVVSDPADNIVIMNKAYTDIKKLFDRDKIKNFVRLPKDSADRQEFKRQFGILKNRLNTLRLQGELKVKKKSNEEIWWDVNSQTGQKLLFDSDTYNILYLRYLDMVDRSPRGPVTPGGMGFNLNTNISEVEMDKINADYLEKHFKMIVPILASFDEDDDVKDKAIAEFKDDFGKLIEKQQKYAEKVLQDIKAGILEVIPDKKFVEYIKEYMNKAKSDAIQEVADRYGVDADMLADIISDNPDEKTINSGMQLNILCDGCGLSKVKAYYGVSSSFKAKSSMNKDIKKFILEDIREI